jgi:succinate dehydrogenase/fumarate reductase-like Fe-S protein
MPSTLGIARVPITFTVVRCSCGELVQVCPEYNARGGYFGPATRRAALQAVARSLNRRWWRFGLQIS